MNAISCNSIQNRSFYNLSTAFSWIVASIFFIYLSFGNFPRFVSMPGLLNNILATEIVLYLICCVSVIFVRPKFKTLIYLVLFASFVLLSAGYGSIVQSYDPISSVHAVRLILLVFCGIQLGHVFFCLFRDLKELLRFFVRAYLVCLFLSLVIYVFFSVSKEFWIFLSGLGIVFFGDPHESRFISVYFDPNFYGAIACIPFMSAYFLMKEVNERKYAIYTCCFLVSIVLTLSRSGIATFFLLICYILKERFKRIRFVTLRKQGLFLLLFLFVFFGCAVFIQRESFAFFLKRTTHIVDDPSALARLENFQTGIDLFLEYPLFGIGYNYTFYQECSIDSSVLMTMVCFGIVPSMLGLLFLCVLLFKNILKIKAKADGFLRGYYSSFLFYVVVTVLFSSHFNNILYYQFWLIPVLSLMTFLSLESKRSVEHLDLDMTSNSTLELYD